MAIGIGTTFRHIHGDENLLWQVTEKVGRGVWLATVVNEPIVIDGESYDSDYASTERSFTTKEITDAIARAAAFAHIRDENEHWWNERAIGQVLHYHDSFGRFIRGEVVLDGEGKKALKPMAMVGAWEARDLPRRDRSGEVMLGYHAQQIAAGEAWRPNKGFMFECETFSNRSGVDPTSLKPLPLTPPEPTSEEQRAFDIESVLSEVRTVVGWYALPAHERLTRAHAILDAAIKGL